MKKKQTTTTTHDPQYTENALLTIHSIVCMRDVFSYLLSVNTRNAFWKPNIRCMRTSRWRISHRQAFHFMLTLAHPKHTKKRKKLRAVVFRGTEGRISYETNASLIQMIISAGKKSPPEKFWMNFIFNLSIAENLHFDKFRLDFWTDTPKSTLTIFRFSAMIAPKIKIYLPNRKTLTNSLTRHITSDQHFNRRDAVCLHLISVKE